MNRMTEFEQRKIPKFNSLAAKFICCIKCVRTVFPWPYPGVNGPGGLWRLQCTLCAELERSAGGAAWGGVCGLASAAFALNARPSLVARKSRFLKSGRVDGAGVGAADFARVISQQSRLQHGVVGQAVQVGFSHAYLP